MSKVVPWGMADEKSNGNAAKNQKQRSFSTNCFLSWHIAAYSADIGLPILRTDLVAQTVQLIPISSISDFIHLFN